MMNLKQVLVATDFSEPSKVAFRYGRELATQFGAVLYVIHVVENMYAATLGAENYVAVTADLQRQIEEDGRQRLLELVGTQKDWPLIVPVLLSSAPPAEAIVDYAKSKDVNLIVIGTNGRG